MVAQLVNDDTFKVRPEFLGLSQPGYQGDASVNNKTSKPYHDNDKKKSTSTEQKKKGAEDKRAAASSSSKPMTLQKVDYLDYIEKTGTDVIQMMMKNNDKVS